MDDAKRCDEDECECECQEYEDGNDGIIFGDDDCGEVLLICGTAGIR